MKKSHWIAALFLGAPLVFAALIAAVTYAANTVGAGAEPVFAASSAGVDTTNGYTMMEVESKAGERYIAISVYAPNPKNAADFRHTLTLYRIEGNGKSAELHLVCSRTIEWDRGYDLLNIKGQRGFDPSVLRKNFK